MTAMINANAGLNKELHFKEVPKFAHYIEQARTGFGSLTVPVKVHRDNHDNLIGVIDTDHLRFVDKLLMESNNKS